MEEETKKREIKITYKSALIICLAIVAVFSIIFIYPHNHIKGQVSIDDAAEKVISVYEKLGVPNITFVEGIENHGIYYLTLESEGQTMVIQVTKDAELAGFLSQLPTDEQINEQEEPAQEVPKSDNPEIELFVMTHCPYGTQAEKGFVPFVESVGDKINAKIRFVHYFMHGDEEEEETYRQLCIREEQSEKYLTYLREFLDAGNVSSALNKANIDEALLNKCLSDRVENYYAEDSEKSQSYGVEGSPTLVINGVIASSGRDAASFLETACNSYNEQPDFCSELSLDISTPSSGFGWEGSSSNDDLSC